MLQQRSNEKELLDLGPAYYSMEEYVHCLRMLFRVNKIFGFFHSTIKMLTSYPSSATLLDVGCGDGLFLLNISKYFPHMTLTGCDISPAAILLATQNLQQLTLEKTAKQQISFYVQSRPELDLIDNSVDIILATMVCHHLTDEELVDFFIKSIKAARLAVIINDLHRHGIPHLCYRLISPILFNNRLISHDGLISIRRGFTRCEWHSILAKANINHYKIKWCFPFRWQLVLWKNTD